MTLVLSESDIDQVLRMEDCLRVLEQTFSDFGLGQAVSRPRTHTYTYVEPDLFYNFKSMDGCVPRFGVHALRISSEHLQTQRMFDRVRMDGIPKAAGGRYVGLVLLFDLESTEPLAIMQDSGIQRMRVGATSGIAAKYIARKDSRRIGLIGTGWQAQPQLEALALTYDIEYVRVYSINPEHRRRFTEEMSARFDFPITAVDRPEDIVRGADIVACATNSQEPVFDGSMLVPGQHVNSINAGELDDATHERASTIVIRAFEKSRHYVQQTAPETPIHMETMLKRYQEGGFEEKFVDLGSVVAGVKPARTNRDEITLFGGSGTGPSSGLGIQFAAVGKIVYDAARARGLGHEIPTDWFTQVHHT